MAVRLLLDTHALLFALGAANKLSATARAALEDPATTLLVSSVCAWEISIKHHLGKLPDAETVLRDYELNLARLGAEELPIRAEHAIRAGALPLYHRDPFDRMLVAQAQEEHASLVTNDPQIREYSLETIW